MAGRPERRAAWRALIRAFSTKLGAGSSGASPPNSAMERRLQPSGANSACSSASLPLLWLDFQKAYLPRAVRCACASSPMPLAARASMASSSSRRKAWPSAVPCTSTNWPASFITTFMSVSQSESSR